MSMPHDSSHNSFSEFMGQSLSEQEKLEVDYWGPLSALVVEFLHARAERDMTQTEIARLMGTRQSVISRFENMGRKPNYDFLARLAKALGGRLGMTLEADFAVKVPRNKRARVNEIAEETGLSTEHILKTALVVGLDRIIRERRDDGQWARSDGAVARSGWMVDGSDTQRRYQDITIVQGEGYLFPVTPDRTTTYAAYDVLPMTTGPIEPCDIRGSAPVVATAE